MPPPETQECETVGIELETDRGIQATICAARLREVAVAETIDIVSKGNERVVGRNKPICGPNAKCVVPSVMFARTVALPPTSIRPPIPTRASRPASTVVADRSKSASRSKL